MSTEPDVPAVIDRYLRSPRSARHRRGPVDVRRPTQRWSTMASGYVGADRIREWLANGSM